MHARKRSISHEPTRRAAIREAAIWFDQGQALIVEGGPGHARMVELDRKLGETDLAFEVRAVNEVLDEDRVVVRGPADTRLEFERAYVAVTHRPDRLVDIELVAPGSARRPSA
jgi:hypothetical protein